MPLYILEETTVHSTKTSVTSLNRTCTYDLLYTVIMSVITVHKCGEFIAEENWGRANRMTESYWNGEKLRLEANNITLNRLIFSLLKCVLIYFWTQNFIIKASLGFIQFSLKVHLWMKDSGKTKKFNLWFL